MRKKITALLVAAAGFAAVAQPAAADIAAEYTVTNYGPVKVFTCTTAFQTGIYGQYGAWGDFIDGCTVRLKCPSASTYCTAYEQTSINTAYAGHSVTQNARLRIFNSAGDVRWFRDQSCGGTNWCENRDSVRLDGNESASVQCDGVRQHADGNYAKNTCTIQMNYEG